MLTQISVTGIDNQLAQIWHDQGSNTVVNFALLFMLILDILATLARLISCTDS